MALAEVTRQAGDGGRLRSQTVLCRVRTGASETRPAAFTTAKGLWPPEPGAAETANRSGCPACGAAAGDGN